MKGNPRALPTLPGDGKHRGGNGKCGPSGEVNVCSAQRIVMVQCSNVSGSALQPDTLWHSHQLSRLSGIDRKTDKDREGDFKCSEL